MTYPSIPAPKLTASLSGSNVNLSWTVESKNILLWTEDFSKSNWSKNAGLTLTYSQADPNGENTAVLVNDPSTSGTLALYQTPAVASDTEYRTGSVFLKQGTAAETSVSFKYYLSGTQKRNASAVITWATSSLTASTDAYNPTFTDVGGGWYLLSVGCVNASWNQYRLQIYPAKYISGGATTGSCYIWHPHLNMGNTPSLYNKMTDGVTADVYTIERSTDGINFSWLADVAEGTYTYADETTSSATTYYYRVKLVRDADESAYSTIAAIISGTITPAGTLVTEKSGGSHEYFENMNGAITTTATTAYMAVFNLAITGAITTTAATVKQLWKAIAGAASGVGSLEKLTQKGWSGNITETSTTTEQFTSTLEPTGAIMATGSLLKLFTRHLALTGAISAAGNIVKKINKGLSGALVAAGNVVDFIGKAFVGVLSSSGGLLVGILLKRVYTGSVSAAGELVPKFIKASTMLTLRVNRVLYAIKDVFRR